MEYREAAVECGGSDLKLGERLLVDGKGGRYTIVHVESPGQYPPMVFYW